MTTRVQVDFTNLVDGLVRARLVRADRPVYADAQVVAFDPDDNLCADAVVVRIAEPFVYLSIDWESQRDDIDDSELYRWNINPIPRNSGIGAGLLAGDVAQQLDTFWSTQDAHLVEVPA